MSSARAAESDCKPVSPAGRNEQGVGSRVAIAGVDGDDHDGAAALFGRIGGKLNEPDFAAQRNAGGRRRGQSGDLRRKLLQSKIAPFGLLVSVFS